MLERDGYAKPNNLRHSSQLMNESKGGEESYPSNAKVLDKTVTGEKN
jgi:hypothetical protein